MKLQGKHLCFLVAYMNSCKISQIHVQSFLLNKSKQIKIYFEKVRNVHRTTNITTLKAACCSWKTWQNFMKLGKGFNVQLFIFRPYFIWKWKIFK